MTKKKTIAERNLGTGLSNITSSNFQQNLILLSLREINNVDKFDIKFK